LVDARNIRMLAIGLAALVVALAGSLISIPLLIGEPTAVVRPNASVPFAAESGLVRAELQVSSAGDFNVLMAVAPEEGTASPPRVAFDMIDHQMAPVEAAVNRLAAGRYAATGRLPMPGRWVMRIARAGQPHEFEFILQLY
jgi:hypothetical protein